MAGEYGVNINLRVKGQSGLDRLNSKVKELSKSVDNIRQIDIMNPRNTGGAAGKGARNDLKKYKKDMDDIVKSVNKAQGAFGKTANQQMAAADALEEYSNSLTIGTKKHKEALAASVKQNTAIGRETNSIIKNTDAQIKNNKAQAQGNKLDKFNNRSNKAAATSGLISGAFPLLFGQGPLGGAFGFAGGFAGTKIGGQMGGFAGGLVATAALQQITTAVEGIKELGRALDPETLNINAVSKSLGLLGTDTEKYLQLIEKTEGKQAAYNLAVQETAKLIGEDGVKALQDFADSSQNLTNEMSKFFTRLGAGIAGLFDKVGKGKNDRTIGFERSNLLAEAKLVTDNKQIVELVEKVKTARGKNRDLLNDQIILLMKARKEQEGIALKTKITKLENEDLKESLEKTKALYNSIASSIETGIVDALEGAINGTKTLGNVASNVFAQIQRSLLQFGVNSFLSALPGGIGKFFGAKAMGGPVKGGGSYIVGEKGPELFTPNSSGNITPNHALGGLTNVVVNVDASGSSVQGNDQSANQLGELIAAAVQSEIVNQKMDGGLLS